MPIAKKRMLGFCQATIDAGFTHLRYKTQASASGITSSKRLVDKMGEAGFDGVFLVVESVNKRNLQFLGKGSAASARQQYHCLHGPDRWEPRMTPRTSGRTSGWPEAKGGCPHFLHLHSLLQDTDASRA